MTGIAELQPLKSQRVYDLLVQTGLDMSEWAVKASGQAIKNPANNPSRATRWAFLEPGRLAVLMLWFTRLDQDSRGIFYTLNARSQAAPELKGNSSNRQRNAAEMDDVVRAAFEGRLPVRVIVVSGVQHDQKGRASAPAQVERRLLDSEFWHVESYDALTGKATVRRAQQIEPAYGLVLAQNESHAGDFDWQDVTGERYQFPNQYRNLIRPGTRFIYYRGSRTADGRRSEPCYFGTGIVGDVSPDPNTEALPAANRKWIADVADYTPFEVEVPFRDGAQAFLETGTMSVARNYWGTGVRKIGRAEFSAIVAHGLRAATPAVLPTLAEELPLSSLGQLTQSLNSPLIGRDPEAVARSRAKGEGGFFNPKRLSKRAKLIGDAAEKLFYEHLLAQELDAARRGDIVWLARDGLTPGYDIEDRRDPGRPVGYEVKGTTGPCFPSFDFTANEMLAAQRMGERYVIVLVTDCLGPAPSFYCIEDPGRLLVEKALNATPSVFRIERLING